MAALPSGTVRLQGLSVALLACLLTAADAFLAPSSLTTLSRRGLSLPGGARRGGSAAAIGMALESGAKVAVLGVFDRVGMVTAWDLTNNSPYKAVIQVPIGFQDAGGRIRWNIDGLPAGFPQGAQICEETLPGYIKGCILASEKPPAPGDIKLIIEGLPDLQKAVLLSSVGVERRDSFFIKFNPFLSIDKWYEAEQAFVSECESRGLEYTVVRTGALQGGPFYNTNPEFQAALEGNLFDLEHKALRLSRKDDIDGKTSRDLASACLVEALQRDEPALSVVSEKSGSCTCSVQNRMQIKLDAGKQRVVYTPSKQDWDAAFGLL